MNRRVLFVALVLAVSCVCAAGCGKKGGNGPDPAARAAVESPPSPPPPAPAVPPVPPAEVPPSPPGPASPAGSAAPGVPVPEAPSAAPLPVEPPAAVPSSASYATRTFTVGDLTVESIQLCAAVENRQCVGEGGVFEPGQMVWALLRLRTTVPAERSVLVSYVAEGTEPSSSRGLRLSMPAQASYTTFSKAAKSSPGRYVVVVRSEQDEVLATAPFEVSESAPAPPR